MFDDFDNENVNEVLILFFARLLCYFFITLIILACFDYIINYYNLIEKGISRVMIRELKIKEVKV